jgi:hypothetical protein
MTFSKPRETTAQSSLETVIALSLLTGIALSGTGLLIQRMGTLVLVKWAALQSRCVAAGQDFHSCEALTRTQLRSWFAFKDIKIKTAERQGIVHTEINAVLVGPVRARYDMGPSEYRRVMQ